MAVGPCTGVVFVIREILDGNNGYESVYYAHKQSFVT